MGKIGDLLLYLWAGAVAQNVLLTTGFGTSTLLKSPWRARQLWRLGVCMTVFCLLTALTVFPIDRHLQESESLRLWRPLLIVGVTAFWYVVSTPMLRRWLPAAYGRWQRLLPLGAFNSVIVGTAMLANHQFELSLLGTVGLCIGACGGFLLLSLLTAAGMRRMDHPDMPRAFRGLPATLLYLGILALAVWGFASPVSFL